MTLRDAREQKVFSETSVPIGQDKSADRPRPWAKRLLERIKQGERFQAYAYFVSTIL